jgi:hypothetical protein
MRKLQVHEVTTCVRAATWQDLQKLADLLPGWVFRGQSDIKWRLQPTLERFAKRITSDHTLFEIEGHMVTQFKRAAPNYLDSLPTHEDIIGWLSLIQSHGGPTRLLDMTRSLYVAAFFALAEHSESSHRVVWAINDRVVRGVLSEILRSEDGRPLPCRNDFEAGELLNSTLTGKFDGPAACAGAPFFLSERLIAQHGLFLLSLNMENTLEQNLYGMFGVDAAEVYPESLVGWFRDPFSPALLPRLRGTPIIKIVLPSEERIRVLADLRRMNITYASLFPGVDGVARGLNHELLEIQEPIRNGVSEADAEKMPPDGDGGAEARSGAPQRE